MTDRFKDNKAICAAPWTHLHVQPDGKVYPCCTALEPEVTYGNTHQMTIQQAWHSDIAQRFRKNLLEGKKQPACSVCYNQEKYYQDGGSLRTSLNNRYGEFITDNLTPDFHIKYLDVRSSNTCNMACVMCYHGLSSSWYEDGLAIDFGVKPNSPKFIEINNAAEAEILKIVGSDLDIVYFAGGEPLLTPYHYTVLDYLIEQDLAKNIRLEYNTNLSVLRYKKRNVFDIWKNFKSVEIRASVDMMGEHAEYQRYGTKWDTIVKNWKEVLTYPDIVIRPQITVTSLSIGVLPEFLNFLTTELECKIDRSKGINGITFNLCYGPNRLCVQNLPDSIKKLYTDRLTTFIQHGNDLANTMLQPCIDFMNEKPATSWYFEHDLLRYMTQLDERRGLNWRKLWPEFIPHFKKEIMHEQP